MHNARTELIQMEYGLVGSRPGFLIISSRINAFAQLFARFEMRYLLARHLHLFPGLGVAPYTRRPLGQRKAAKSADFDALTGRQGLCHGLEHRFDGVISITRRQLRITASKYRYQFRLCHAN